jgi:hypothetical protein
MGYHRDSFGKVRLAFNRLKKYVIKGDSAAATWSICGFFSCVRYPKSQKPSHQLSWAHYAELLKIYDELERSFY